MAGNDSLINGRSPVTKKSNGTVVTGPDVCKTQAGPPVVPIPYPNIAKSSDLVKEFKSVKVNGEVDGMSTSINMDN